MNRAQKISSAIAIVWTLIVMAVLHHFGQLHMLFLVIALVAAFLLTCFTVFVFLAIPDWIIDSRKDN